MPHFSRKTRNFQFLVRGLFTTLAPLNTYNISRADIDSGKQDTSPPPGGGGGGASVKANHEVFGGLLFKPSPIKIL
jgi:hypothetical protein